jgi:hypothetical protein
MPCLAVSSRMPSKRSVRYANFFVFFTFFLRKIGAVIIDADAVIIGAEVIYLDAKIDGTKVRVLRADLASTW